VTQFIIFLSFLYKIFALPGEKKNIFRPLISTLKCDVRVALIGCLKKEVEKEQDYLLLNKVDFRINFISGLVLSPIFLF
jgi:hypothetical protein